MRKRFAFVMTGMMALGLAAFCGRSDYLAEEAGQESTVSDPQKYFCQFDEPFELHVCFGIGSDAVDTLEGDDTAEDNYYTRWLLDNYNIKVVYDWTASQADFDQKLAMSISSDTLPDAWICGPQYWKAAAKNGQLRDITEDYENYICDELKNLYDVAGERVMEACSYDGALTCLTGMTVTTEGVSVIMINKKWLDELNLEPPKTLEDVTAVARAFKEAKLAGDATIPILGPANDNRLYSTFNDSFNCLMGLDAVFAACGSYPGFFYEEDGEVVYGSLTPETKEALSILHDWYEEGLLDPEIGIRTTGFEPINANNCGMFFGQWWDIGFGNPASFTNDPEADWRAYALYADDGKWYTKIPDITAGARFCISADASDDAARAAIIAVNALYGSATNDINVETNEDIAWYPLRLVVAPEDFVDRAREHCLAVLNDEEDIDLYKGDLTYNEIWQSSQYVKELIPNYTPGQEIGSKDFVISDDNANWQAIYSWIIGDAPYSTVEREKEVAPVISYMTPSMELYWDNLESVEKSTMLSIITGEKDISAFDEFVEQWKSEGGDTILEEVKGELG